MQRDLFNSVAMDRRGDLGTQHAMPRTTFVLVSQNLSSDNLVLLKLIATIAECVTWEPFLNFHHYIGAVLASCVSTMHKPYLHTRHVDRVMAIVFGTWQY